MTPLEDGGLDTHFAAEKKEIEEEKRLFTDTDLKEFNELVKDENDFAILLKGLQSRTILTETNDMPIYGGKDGLKAIIDKEIGKNPNQSEIFDKEYTMLTQDQRDLYETSILGGMLKDENSQVKEAHSPDDYKRLGKEYYLIINPAKEKKDTANKEIQGTYASATTDIKQETITDIQNTTKIEAGKNITEASVTISAGADLRKMNEQRAKGLYEEKVKVLEEKRTAFADKTNQDQITNIIAELKDTGKIAAINKGEEGQEGNRYLIAARVAEGFIKALDNLSMTPEPTLTLRIDRDKCAIGTSKEVGDKEGDRFVQMNVAMTMIASTTEQKITPPKTEEKEEEVIVVEVTKDKTAVAKNTAPDDTGKEETVITQVVEKEAETTGQKKESENIAGKPEEKNTAGESIVKAKEKTAEKAIENVETPEIINLKKDIARYFTINGKNISRETDISNAITLKNNIYTVSLQGYRGLQFTYETTDGKKHLVMKENKDGGIRKGLFLYDVGPSKYDPANPDINNDIKPQLDTTKTIESLNKQLEKNDMDGDKKADYTVKSITEDKMEIEYGAKFMQDKKDSNKPKTDTFTLEIDKASNMILPDSQQAGQVSQWKKVESAMIQDQDFTFDGEHKPETGKKIVYYAKSGIVAEGTAEFTIMNNIQKTVTGGYESMYADHKEMTNPEFKEIKEDLLTNRIERIFAGTLHESHKTDFQNNRKIMKDAKTPGRYDFEIAFNKNDGKQQNIVLPFTVTTTTDGTNTRKYTFENKGKVVNIDNISYDISTTGGEVPSVKMIENKEKTLNNAEKNTSKNVASDIFTEKTKTERLRGSDNNTYEVQPPKFSLGPIEFDGKGGYRRDLFLGEQKDANGNILLAGEEKGKIYFDQDYKIIHVNMIRNGKEEEVDFGDTERKVDMENVLEDEDADKKGIVLMPDIVAETGKVSSLQLNFKSPKDTDKNRQTTELYLNRIRDEKETIFTALKNMSTTLTTSSEVFRLPKRDTKDEASYPQKIIGPDAKGLYQRKIAEAAPDGKYLEQCIYCKVEGKVLVICDSDGKKIDNTYLIDYKNKDYYELKTDTARKENFSVRKLDKAEKQQLISLKTETIDYQNPQIAINMNDETVDLLESNLTNRFTFSSNKHEMCTIYLDGERKLDEEKTLESGEKKPQVIEPNNVNNVFFGSYKKYFAGNDREHLGIAEKDYEEAFKNIYSEYQAGDADKKVVQVKLRSSSDRKYYYEYMGINQIGKNFKLEKLEGMEKAREEMKRRLDNLVALDKMQASAKGDILRGVKINTKDDASRLAYLKDKNSPVKISLSDTAGEVTAPIEITMKEHQDRSLKNNRDIPLGNQKINCTKVRFEDDIPFLKIELITQSKD